MNFFIQKMNQLTPEDIDSIIELIQSVYIAMPYNQKEWFAIDNAEYTRSLLESNKGWAYTAREEETGILAGVFLTAFPEDSKENLGHDIGLSHEALQAVAHMDSAAIAPSFRGNHLQSRLMKFAEKDLRAAGFRYLCCTIHPNNQYSMNSALSLGYKKATICEKYGGYLRAVLVKDLMN